MNWSELKAKVEQLIEIYGDLPIKVYPEIIDGVGAPAPEIIDVTLEGFDTPGTLDGFGRPRGIGLVFKGDGMELVMISGFVKQVEVEGQ